MQGVTYYGEYKEFPSPQKLNGTAAVVLRGWGWNDWEDRLWGLTVGVP